ncbi:MAG TPA: DMT family transporter [Rudaea sp.]|jgi:drug/metabolite transporter (DMT)-like permease|nr:DMT family transporter [Rudaea sp.]
MTPTAKAQWQIHFCVILWGFTAILGKLITLQALALVWWRMLIVVAALVLVPAVWRGLRAMPLRLIAAYAGIGCLVALHWLTFYGAIKLANASVAATCMGIGPAFLALVEPWLTGKRFDARELALGVLVIPGVVLVAGGVPASMHLGLGVGILSALLVALFGALNKRLVEHADPLTVTAVELGAGTLLLTALAPLLPHDGPLLPIPDLHDVMLLLVLSIGCTLLPYTIALAALRKLSAFYVQLATNLEPIYAIALAIVLLGEQRDLGVMFYLGVAIILMSVFAHPLLARTGTRVEHAEMVAVAEAKNVAD